MEALDPAEWPRWFHHASLESVLCATPEDAEALPEGFRRLPWSEADKHLNAMAVLALEVHAEAKRDAVFNQGEEQAGEEQATEEEEPGAEEEEPEQPPAPSRGPFRVPPRSKAAAVKRRRLRY
jgi:hypothetical protein